MKFSCDACGAQYMIADEKIGPRGVKVRCKKCANVIILRPDEVPVAPSTRISPVPDSVRAHTNSSRATTLRDGAVQKSRPVPSAPPPPPLDGEDSDATIAADSPPGLAAGIAPSVAAASGGGLSMREDDIGIPPEAVAATSSDFGLSVEFAAAGFDEPTSQFPPRARAKTLSVGLDVSKVSAPVDSVGSPFTARIATGGSLDGSPFDAPAPANGSSDPLSTPAGLGGALLDGEDSADPAEQTRIDGQTLADDGDDDDDDAREMKTAVGMSPFASDDDDSDDDDSVASDAPSNGASRGVIVDPSLGDEADSELIARAEFEAAMAGRASEPPTLDSGADDEVGAAARAEAAALVAEIDKAAGRGGDDTDQAARVELAQSADRRPTPTDDFDSTQGAGRREDEAPERAETVAESSKSASPIVAPSVSDPSVSDPSESGVAVGDLASNLLENEIGNAFDSVFGGDDGDTDEPSPAAANEPSDPFAAVVASATEGLEESGIGDSDVGRAPASTRVFDSEAMQRVQSEQDMAQPAPRSESTVVKKEAREWYVAIDDEQVGPLTVSEVKTHLSDKAIDANSLCWKPGMADWIALRFVKELEPLSRIEEAARTMVAKVDLPADDEPDRDALRAPTDEDISQPVLNIPAEATRPAERLPSKIASLDSVQGSPDDPLDPSEPSWRPSAASALAELAAEEFDRSPSSPGGSLPGGDGAISALLDDGKSGAIDRSASTLFGAAELSSSRVIRPLPKSADVASSIPLRDPIADREKRSWVMPALVSAVIVGLIAALLFVLMRPPPPAPVEVAKTDPTVIKPINQPVVAPTPSPDPEPVALAAAPGGTDPTAEPTAPAPADAKPSEPEAREVEDPEPTKRKSKTGRTPRKKRTPKPVEDEPPEPEPEAKRAPPPPPPEDITAGDLLAVGKPKSRRPDPEPEEAVPETLDDDQILRILRKHGKQIKECRSKQSTADPTLEGVMTVKFLIRKNGRTFNHSVSPSKFSESVVGKCILGSVRGWVFPKFSGRPLPLDFPVKIRAQR